MRGRREQKQDRRDRELYPAVLVTAALLGCGLLIWKYVLGKPALAACPFYTRFHLYCPACGGTRALLALKGGHVLQALAYNPAVPFVILSAAAYLLSQTLWRLRGRRGWVLRESAAWWKCLAILLAANCVLRNLLWAWLQIPL
jgi:hypothetical protein